MRKLFKGLFLFTPLLILLIISTYASENLWKPAQALPQNRGANCITANLLESSNTKIALEYKLPEISFVKLKTNRINGVAADFSRRKVSQTLILAAIPFLIIGVLAFTPSRQEYIQHQIREARQQQTCVFEEMSADKLALELIELCFSQDNGPQKVLDVGTGTGILAIACALLGALTVLAVLPAPAATPETQTAKMYMEYCSVCHGDKGDGKSHARQGLRPPPRDFTTGDVRRQLSREHMIAVVKDGKPGTAMVGWETRLSDGQIEALVDYIRERFMPASQEAAAGTSPGGQIYAKTCSVCHGEDGAGALWGKTSLHPPPVNFTAADRQQELPRERMIASVTHGRPGTAMTAFASQLSASEIEAVVEKALDKKMKPLIEMLAESQQKSPDIGDIIGGIGYIIGLVGIAAYFHNRKKNS